MIPTDGAAEGLLTCTAPSARPRRAAASDDRVVLPSVGSSRVCDDEDGQRDAADQPRPRGGEHAVLGPRGSSRLRKHRLVADCNPPPSGHRFVGRWR